jgi:hypothetical protein
VLPILDVLDDGRSGTALNESTCIGPADCGARSRDMAMDLTLTPSVADGYVHSVGRKFANNHRTYDQAFLQEESSDQGKIVIGRVICVLCAISETCWLLRYWVINQGTHGAQVHNSPGVGCHFDQLSGSTLSQ